MTRKIGERGLKKLIGHEVSFFRGSYLSLQGRIVLNREDGKRDRKGNHPSSKYYLSHIRGLDNYSRATVNEATDYNPVQEKTEILLESGDRLHIPTESGKGRNYEVL